MLRETEIAEVGLSTGERPRNDSVMCAESATDAATLGMTLVEIMVVVMIIGLIVGSVGVVAFNQFRKAQVKNTQAMLKEVESGIEMYMMDNNGSCPKDLHVLFADRILNKEPKDAWGETFLYRCPGEKNESGVDLLSKGPDKKEGTDDDIKNWEE